MKKIVLLLLLATGSILMAGGWKVPEVSTNAVALGAANIAHNHNGADAAYYNPAKMIFMSNENHLDANLMYVGLDAVKYNGAVYGTGPYSLESKKENFLIPSLQYVSAKKGNFRIGLSISSGGGLSKRWTQTPAKSTAEEFTLKTVDVNPSLAFAVNDKLSLAAGVRVVYSEGIVKSTAAVSRDMNGDSFDYGYNLALAYQPIEDVEIGVTYRSKIDLTEEGNAKLYSGAALAYDGAVSVTVPLPATLSTAIAYTFPTKTTIEFVYERTYWSTYKNLDFNYPVSIGALASFFDDPKTKNWKDTNTFRLGLTQELDEMSVMAGLVIDESPIPNQTLSFELPTSDVIAVSLGLRYKLNEKMDIACAVLYATGEKKTVNNSSIQGTFSESKAILLSVGLGYRF